MTDQELFINNLIKVVSPQHTTSSPERKLDILNEWLHNFNPDEAEDLKIDNEDMKHNIKWYKDQEKEFEDKLDNLDNKIAELENKLTDVEQERDDLKWEISCLTSQYKEQSDI